MFSFLILGPLFEYHVLWETLESPYKDPCFDLGGLLLLSSVSPTRTHDLGAWSNVGQPGGKRQLLSFQVLFMS